MSIESDFIAGVAEEYRARGYGVEVGEPLPPDFGLPPSHRVDLVAYGPDETVVVEAKRRSAVGGDSQIRRLAEAIAGRPGWRLELLLIPDEAQPESATPRNGEPAAVAREQLLRAATLRDQGLEDAALLLAFAAGEGLMRLLLSARRSSASLEKSPIAMAKTLVSLGDLDETDLARVADALADRNAIAHGFVPRSDLSRSLEAALDVFTRLSSQVEDR